MANLKLLIQIRVANSPVRYLPTSLMTWVGTKLSMDGKGRCIDNIFIERFWRSLKYEKIYLEPSDDGIELYCKVKWYIDFYNTRRLHQSLGYDKPERVYTRAA